jgi:uncharacterized protein (TIGR02271 family)
MTSKSAQDAPDPKRVEVSKVELSQAEVPHAIRETLIPLHAEELSVSKEKVETGRVHVGTVTRTHDELVDQELANERVEIERVPLNIPIDAVPAVRQEGDVTIVPVIEEVLVTKRSLLLKEEIHIRRIHTTERHREYVTLRRQEAVISRLPTKPSPE